MPTYNVENPGPNDGDSKADRAVRDARGVVGGTRGFTNCLRYTVTITGKGQTAFEWNDLAVLYNYADAGENCARYTKAVKIGKGDTWGHCVEMRASDPDNDTATVTVELDSFVAGPDKTGTRVCQDIVVGDAQYLDAKEAGKPYDPAGKVVEVFAGQRIDACNQTPWARWLYGKIIKAFKRTGVLIETPVEGAERGVELRGKMIVGIDASQADVQSAVRLREGQLITFENTDQIGFGFKGGRFRIVQGSVELFSVDVTDGSIRSMGRKVALTYT